MMVFRWKLVSHFNQTLQIGFLSLSLEDVSKVVKASLIVSELAYLMRGTVEFSPSSSINFNRNNLRRIVIIILLPQNFIRL
jgi:hypothetical protein